MYIRMTSSETVEPPLMRPCVTSPYTLSCLVICLPSCSTESAYFSLLYIDLLNFDHGMCQKGTSYAIPVQVLILKFKTILILRRFQKILLMQFNLNFDETDDADAADVF